MKMFSFVKRMFVLGLAVLSSSITGALSATPLNCISLKNQQCKVRPKIIDINSNNSMLYPFSIKVNKCNGNCNNISDPHAKICDPDTVRDLNVRVFNLMSRTNQTRHIEWHKTCKCICRLDKIICNSKLRLNEDKCRCECKELIDKGVCDKGYVWNPSNSECECDKSCNIGEYLDYSSCKCRKKLIDSLVEECTENINETELIKVTVENKNNDRCRSYVVYKVLFAIFFMINIVIIIYFVYHKYVDRNKYDSPY